MTANDRRVSDGPHTGEGIPGLAEWFDAQEFNAREALRTLAELLNNIPAKKPDDGEDFDHFVQERMGVHPAKLVSETRDVIGVDRISVGLALGELITTHQPEIGPAAHQSRPPRWETAQVGSETHHFPRELAFFSDAIIPGIDTVVAIRSSGLLDQSSSVSIYVWPQDQEHALDLLETILARADVLNIYRGRVLRASAANTLTFEVIALPPGTRRDIVATADVWGEIDLNVRAVSTDSQMMKRLGLGVRRGVLLAGPPGVGKSAITSVVANELAGPFTIVYCDARAGTAMLTDVFNECVRFGASAVVIEDIDLIVRRRDHEYSSHALSEFLAALDSHPSAQLLILATTNDVATLDAAAVRAARFDSIIEVPYPSAAIAKQILTALLREIPGTDSLDLDAVASALPPRTSGADLREIVRRSVLTTGGTITTDALLSQVTTGRYRPTMPTAGAYL